MSSYDLFGNTSSSYSLNNFSMLSDYASIRNGSYGKLMKSYYSGSSNSAVSNMVSGSTSTSSDETKKLTTIKDNSSDLKKNAEALTKLGKDSVFNKVTKKNDDGTTTTDYDKDAIYKSISSFVDSYNEMIDSGLEADSTSILRTMKSMVGATNANSKMLGKMGISVSSDGTMKLDKDTFMSADMETVKSLFNGSGSYASNIAQKAGTVNKNAEAEARKANTYSKYGSYNYNYSAGTTYNSWT